MPTELRKIYADLSTSSTIGYVILATICVVVAACFIGAFAVPLPYLVVVPEPVCPLNSAFTGFCAFQSFDRSYSWRSMFTGLNTTNMFIQITGQFHVIDETDNIDGDLTRLFLQHSVHLKVDCC